MKILKEIYLIPLYPFICIVAIWVITKIHQNTNEIDIELLEEYREELEVTSQIKCWMKKAINKNKGFIHGSCIFLWIVIINYMIN